MASLRGIGVTILCAVHVLCATRGAARANHQVAPEDHIVVRSGLVLPFAVRGGRVAFARDPVAMRLARGAWERPKPGDPMRLSDGQERRWELIEADESGWFRGRMLIAGYVSAVVSVPESGVYILEAQGHSAVFVNGVPRGGNPYAYNYFRLPVALNKGENDLLFRVGRGRLRATLRAPRGPVELITGDVTAPDIVRGDRSPLWLAMPVVNCTDEPLGGLVLAATDSSGEVLGQAELPELPPCSVYKAPLQVAVKGDVGGETLRLAVTVGTPGQPALDRAEFDLRVVEAETTRKVTFRSGIDGSVQYYAVVPFTGEGPHGLVLTLHGAAVEAIGQARAYRAKEDLWIVAPTNRRPFGFDWEDWGRLDAIEVLELVQRRYLIDGRRVYLTGHSMGGHGTWHLGVTFPDRFAAIGPSAGWISFAHYGGGRRAEEGLTAAEEAVSTGSVTRPDTGPRRKPCGCGGICVAWEQRRQCTGRPGSDHATGARSVSFGLRLPRGAGKRALVGP